MKTSFLSALRVKIKSYFVFRTIKYTFIKFIEVLVQNVNDHTRSIQFYLRTVFFFIVGGRRTHRTRTVTVSTYVFGADSQSVHFRLQNIGAIPQQCKAYLVFLDYMCSSMKSISWKSNCGKWVRWRRSNWKKNAMTECKWRYYFCEWRWTRNSLLLLLKCNRLWIKKHVDVLRRLVCVGTVCCMNKKWLNWHIILRLLLAQLVCRGVRTHLIIFTRTLDTF